MDLFKSDEWVIIMVVLGKPYGKHPGPLKLRRMPQGFGFYIGFMLW